MANEIPSVNLDKLAVALDLIDRECDLLRAWKRSSRIMTDKPKSDPVSG